jgi:hypothetical protein
MPEAPPELFVASRALPAFFEVNSLH